MSGLLVATPQRGEKLRDPNPGQTAWPTNLRTELVRPVVVYGIGPDGTTQYPPLYVATPNGGRRPLNEQEQVGVGHGDMGCRQGEGTTDPCADSSLGVACSSCQQPLPPATRELSVLQYGTGDISVSLHRQQSPCSFLTPCTKACSGTNSLTT